MRMLNRALLGAVALGALAAARPAVAGAAADAGYKHVMLISVDGLHDVDLVNWVRSHPTGQLARLSNKGATFANAYTTAPSDSFPGMVAQVTGASPKTAGVFYDDSYERTFFAPGSSCVGDAGAEITYAENIDINQDLLTGGGTLGQPLTQIDPAKLPLRLVGGVCKPVYPHEFIRANTVFEIIKAAGLRTAWSDKHPAYEILNGPSGHGIDDLYTPEINSLIPGQTKDNTTSYQAVRRYDATKVHAVLNQIDGLDSTGRKPVGVPAIFGMNFQAVSVGQKLAKAGYMDDPALVGGYLDANGTPGNALTLQLSFVDVALFTLTRELEKQGLATSTLIIVSAKHGQSPIDVTTRVAVDDAPYDGFAGAGFHIADDVGLVWLNPKTRSASLAGAKSYLLSHAAQLHIATLLDPASLATIYQDPAHSSRTPDFVAVPQHGVIYTGGSKLSEHGGFDEEDRHVALLVSAPRMIPVVNYGFVETKQIAPTILRALGLDAGKLIGVQREGTQALPF